MLYTVSPSAMVSVANIPRILAGSVGIKCRTMILGFTYAPLAISQSRSWATSSSSSLLEAAELLHVASSADESSSTD